MSYVVLARKWRPRTFENMVGQMHIVRTLKNAIEANRVSHAYLFTGPRGVGKTTTARLLAKAVNCLAPDKGEPCNHCVRCEEIMSGATTDVIEIDAASNGLVDDARDLREKVRYTPASCRYKVIIIDEVHMMSNSAFNALLKTLEEPPAHTIFILATTEAHKVPATIISRCQRFDFRRIPLKEIAERLAMMAVTEGIQVEEEALFTLARAADGSLRDAQSLFDQVISFSGMDIKSSDVVAVLGLVDNQIFIQLVDALAQKQAPQAMQWIETLVERGSDLRLFMRDWVDYWRSLVVARIVENPQQSLNLAAHVVEEVVRQSKLFPLDELLQLAKMAAVTDDEMRRTQHPRMLLELFLMRICAADRLASLESMMRQLQEMEMRVAKLPAAPWPNAPLADSVAAAAAAPVPATPVGADNPATAPASAAAPEQPVVEGEAALVIESLEEAAPASPLEQVRQLWPKIFQTVGQQNRRVQALLRDVEVTGAEEGLIEITCASPYHQTGLEKEESRKLLVQILEAELGRHTRLQFKCAAQNQTNDQAEAGNGQDAVEQKKNFDDIARKEPLVMKTLEIFGGKIVDVVQKPNSGGNHK